MWITSFLFFSILIFDRITCRSWCLICFFVFRKSRDAITLIWRVIWVAAHFLRSRRSGVEVTEMLCAHHWANENISCEKSGSKDLNPEFLIRKTTNRSDAPRKFHEEMNRRNRSTKILFRREELERSRVTRQVSIWFTYLINLEFEKRRGKNLCPFEFYALYYIIYKATILLSRIRLLFRFQKWEESWCMI